MRNLNRLNLMAVVIGFTICGCVSTEFTRTGTFKTPPRAEGCEFAVYTIPPHKPYKEIGILEFSSPATGRGADSVETLKKLAQKDVCAQGGNGLLLWQANGFGHYMKATVIFVEE